MTRTILAVVTTIAALVFGLLRAAASEPPWCAVISMTEDSVYWDCQYRSFEECRSNVLAGNRGWCNPNPYYVTGPKEPKRPRKHSARPQ
jgi:hypothetical protein